MSASNKPDEVQSLLQSTKVGDFRLTPRPDLTPESTVGDAVRDMQESHHGSVTICKDGRLAGIFTERDLLRLLAKHADETEKVLEMPMADVMTKTPALASTSDTLLDVTRRMDEGGYRRLPVLDDTDTCLGFVDVKTITHFLVEHFPKAIYNQASYQESLAKAREGA